MIQHTHSRRELENKNNKTKEKLQQTCETIEILQLKICVKQGTEHTYNHSYKHTHSLTQHYRSAQEEAESGILGRDSTRVVYIVCAKDEVEGFVHFYFVCFLFG